MGFEPTSENTVDLKSTPLDHTRALIRTVILIFYTPGEGLEPSATRLKGVRSTN